jgi:hypothetical protein
MARIANDSMHRQYRWLIHLNRLREVASKPRLVLEKTSTPAGDEQGGVQSVQTQED